MFWIKATEDNDNFNLEWGDDETGALPDNQSFRKDDIQHAAYFWERFVKDSGIRYVPIESETTQKLRNFLLSD